MRIIIFGGAGYIGSVAVHRLLERGHEVTVYDNLLKGRRELVPNNAHFIEADILDTEALNQALSEKEYDAAMHFAALKDAGESMIRPELYSNNIIGTINILNAMLAHDVKKIIFSSSAATYGNPQADLVTEGHPTEPINYYGFSKREAERVMEWYNKLKGLEYVSLRYFNVAGDGGLGYLDPNAKNIFPILAEVINGNRDKLSIFGGDYSTRDGTCIRDYIHVIDLVDAHILALELQGSHIINLGTGTGFTVLELVDAFKRISGKDLPYEIVDRRPGDPAFLLASNQKAKELMGWKPNLGIDEMVKSTLAAYQ